MYGKGIIQCITFQIILIHCLLNKANRNTMDHFEIKKFREKNSLTQSQLAEITGVSVSAVRSWEQNQRNITQGAIKLIEAFKAKEKDMPEEHRPGKLIPFYDDVSSIGGNSEITANMGGVTEPADYIDTGDWFKDATAAIRHYGESMVEYPTGCILALKEVDDRELIIPGRDYMVETSEYRVTKRIQKGKDADHVTAYSTNPDTYGDGRLIHEPFDIPWRAILRISLVLGYVVKKNGGTMVFSNSKRS